MPQLQSAPARPAVKGAAVLAGSVVLGGLTSYAQMLLPEAAKPLANSASGWTLITAALVYWSRARSAAAALLGAASFVLLVLGYTAVSQLRGFPYSPVLFGVVGVLVGPAVGLAAAWLRAAGARAAAGTAALAGIALGEAAYGVMYVADSTGAGYWIAIGVAGLALLGAMSGRLRRPLAAVAMLGAGGVATCFLVAYRAVGSAGPLS